MKINKYINFLKNKRVKEYEGYNYICSLKIYVPISCCCINSVIRKEAGLQLVEEMVLKLIANNIFNIDEFSKILGLDKEIINNIVGGLYVKNLLTITGENCSLTLIGTNVLKNMKEIKLQPEKIYPVYINLITGEIYTERYNNQIKKYSRGSYILSRKIKIDNNFINTNFNTISDIFDEQQRNYNYSESTKREVYKIENIDEKSIEYLELAVNIYKSKLGGEIEIASNENIDDMKDEILTQMINENKFKYIFKSHSKNKIIDDSKLEYILNENTEEIKRILDEHNKSKKDQKFKLEELFYKLFKKDRTLLDNELEIMISELSESAKFITIYCEKIEQILFRSDLIDPIIKAIKKGTKINIFYTNSKNFDVNTKYAFKSHPELKEVKLEKINDIIIKDTKINFESKFEIILEKYDLLVLDNKYITKEIAKIKLY